MKFFLVYIIMKKNSMANKNVNKYPMLTLVNEDKVSMVLTSKGKYFKFTLFLNNPNVISKYDNMVSMNITEEQLILLSTFIYELRNNEKILGTEIVLKSMDYDTKKFIVSGILKIDKNDDIYNITICSDSRSDIVFPLLPSRWSGVRIKGIDISRSAIMSRMYLSTFSKMLMMVTLINR